MIFKATWDWVLGQSPHTGEPKTQTRRPQLPGDIFDADRVVRANGHARWILDGRPYTVQSGRGKPGCGAIVICRIVSCPVVGDISDADARAEGFATPADFRAVIANLYGAGALAKPFWALTFRCVEAKPCDVNPVRLSTRV